MGQSAVKQNQIVMNFTTPPSIEEILALAEEMLEYIPEEIKTYVGDFSLEIEEFPDMDVEDDLDLESPYDQLAFYKSLDLPMNSTGVSAIGKGDADILILYRRPILDLWCETGQDLSDVLRYAIVQEVGLHCGFNDDEIDEMIDSITL